MNNVETDLRCFYFSPKHKTEKIVIVPHIIKDCLDVLRAYSRKVSKSILIVLKVVGEANVSTLQERLRLTQPETSIYLKGLKDAGLVTSRTDGKERVYSIVDDNLRRTVDLIDWILTDTCSEKKTINRAKYILNNLSGDRLDILVYLDEQIESNVGDIARDLDLSQSKVSQALSKLRDFNLVGFEKSGKQRFYSVNYENLEEFALSINLYHDHVL